jgi:ABC-type lipoprotein export system ATPase subunit
MLPPLIRIHDLRKSYRSEVETVWAAHDVCFEARPGEFVCVYGASGSGKSTLLNLVAGLDVADSGDIQVGDVDVSEAGEKERARMRLDTVGVVFQEHHLIEEFTATENVALPLEARGMPTDSARAQASDQLGRVGLTGIGNRFPRQLSGGQRQRVGIARALTGQRAVLLADEPTGALDSAATLDVFKVIRSLCDQGVTAVVCSHDTRCRDFADTRYEMVDGRLESRS